MADKVLGMGGDALMRRAVNADEDLTKIETKINEQEQNFAGVARVREYVRFLEANVAKSLMINETLWELMNEKLGVSSEDFFAKLEEVDMRDGVLDNKNQKTVIECKCGRKNSGKQPCCIYCGELFDKSVFSM